MREIPKKNYFIFGCVILVSVLIVLYLMSWYQKTQPEDTYTIMGEVVSEVRSDEMSSYLQDNPNTIIYVAPSNVDDYVSLEKEFKKLIVKKELTNEVVYLDSSQVSENFYQEFANHYLNEELKKKNIDLSVIPNLIFIKEGKIVDTMNTVSRDTKIEDVEQFLEKNGAY
ncbi:MAG: hypothetical protein KH135_03750 [Firmicutes bacterium]|nr:hypothetical protein [Bacillota bacterium]